MENYKFKKGDRVCVVTLEHNDYYGEAKYKVGDIGTVLALDNEGSQNDYFVKFDRLRHSDGPTSWYVLEKWLAPVGTPLIVCE